MSLAWKFFFAPYVFSHWSLAYLFNRLRHVPKPVHIIFCTVDHYEPGTGGATPEIEDGRMEMLLHEYPVLAASHRDSQGNPPRRTWFFPPHYHRNNNLKRLVSLCEKGFGEIELHLHHGKILPDTAANLERTLHQCIGDYSRFGIFGREEGRKRFGFIHGDWALNNSLGGRFCGVDNELEVLYRAGCYADFTFPSRSESNPLQINSIFYAPDSWGPLKSHRFGKRVNASGKGRGLMLIQGPIFPHSPKGISSTRIWGDIIGRIPVTAGRIDSWVKTGIHVKGRPDWVFVKTHTHGAVDHENVLGVNMDFIFRYLESRYNDGEEYILHYVTAREMYNIIKAAEAGEEGDNPAAYRDYRIEPPLYNSALDCEEASGELKDLVARTYR